ncbi:Ig-like domain repeat protein [Nocardioides sp. 1609]|uniref:Ig-like domain repeat protein n=1 Tax=Nocardioides sp. 1609 TaxID=2508327 RepID=UPI00106F9EA0|nr:Ig-like domain repeat protein [Nocardioides sp. 1609]
MRPAAPRRLTTVLTAALVGALVTTAATAVPAVAATPQTPVLTDSAATPRLVSATPWTPAVTTPSSGTPITFSVVATPAGACTTPTDRRTITLVAPGSCAVTATVPGDATYEVGTASKTFQVRRPQSPAFTTPTTAAQQVSATPWSPPITTPSTGTPISYAVGSTPAAVCTAAADGSSVTLVGPGDCAVTATVPGDTTYAVGTAAATYRVRRPRTFAITAPTGSFRALGTWTPVVTGAGTSSVELTSRTPVVCSIAANGVDVSLLEPGDCTVRATVEADTEDDAAQDDETIAVGLADPALSIAQPTASSVVRGTWTPVVTQDGDEDVTLEVSDADACTVRANGTSVRLDRAGACEVTASVPAGTLYDADSATATMDVDARTVEISWSVAPVGPRYRDLVKVTAQARDSVTDEVVPGSGHIEIVDVDAAAPADATWVDGRATREFEAPGVRTYVARADFVPTDTGVWASVAAASYDVVVGRAALTASIPTPPAADLVVGRTWTDAATLTPSDSGLTPVLTSQTTSSCTVSGNDVTFLTTDTCTLRASHPGTSLYAAASAVTRSVTAATAPVDVVVTSSPAAPVFGSTVTVTATVRDRASGDLVTGGTGSMTITGVANPSPATVTWTGGTYTRTFTAGTVGSVSAVATFNGVAKKYATATGTGTITVAKASSPITWNTGAVPSPAYAGRTWVTGAVKGASPQPLVITTADAAVCTVSGTTVTLVAGGTCTVYADQAEGATHEAAHLEHSFQVVRRPVTLTATVDETAPVYGDTVTVTVVATDTLTGARLPGSGTIAVDAPMTGDPEAVTYASTGPALGAATRRLTSVPVGSFTISATYTATPTHAAGTTTRPLVVAKAPQSVTVGTAPSPAYVGQTWEPLAARGPSSGAVTIVPSGSCTVAGLVVTFTVPAPGTCTVSVTQAGDGNYQAAPAVERTVAVTSRPVRIAVTTTPAAPEFGVLTTVVVQLYDALQPAASADVVLGTGTAVVAGFPASQQSFDPVTGRATLTYTPTAAGPQDIVVTFTAATTRHESFTGRTASITVALAKQVVTLGAAPAKPDPGRVTKTWTPTLTSTNATQPIVLATVPAASVYCSVSAGVVTFDREGTCELQATQAAVPTKYSAATPVSILVTVDRIQVTVTLRVTPVSPVDGEVVTDLAVDRELEVRAEAFARGEGTGGSNLKIAGTGAIGIDRVAGGTATTLAQTANPTTAWFGSGRFLSATPVRAGSYQVWHEFAPTDSRVYEVAPYVAPAAGQPQPLRQVSPTSLTVGRAGQDIDVTPRTGPDYVDGSWFPAPTGGGSGNPVVVEASGGCTLRGTTAAPEVYLTSPTLCTVTFHQDGDDDYLAADRVVSFTVDRAPTTVTLSVSGSPRVGTPVTVTARATASSLAGAAVPGDYAIAVAGQPDAVTVPHPDGTASTTWTPTSRGPVEATATFAPDDDNAFADSIATPVTVAVDAGTQTFSSADPPADQQYVGDGWTPAAVVTHGPAGAEVAVDVATPAVCRWDGTVVHLEAEGTCTVTLGVVEAPEGAASPDWLPATTVSRTIGVLRNPTAIALPSAASTLVTRPGTTFQDPALTIPATLTGRLSGDVLDPGALAGTVVFTRTRVSTDPVDPPGPVELARVVAESGAASTDVSFTRFGSYTVTATFVPSDPVTFAGSTTSYQVLVRKHAQTITQVVPPTPAKVLTSWTYPFAESSAGLPVVVTPTSASCTAAGAVVTYSAVGACTITFSQPGDDYYAAAPTLGATVAVERNATSVAVLVPAGATVGAPTDLTATVTSVLPVPGAAPAGGTVQFSASGLPVGDPVPVVGGRATLSWVPTSAGDTAVRAVFVPTGTSEPLYAGSDATGSSTVAPAPVDVELVITADAVRATVSPQRAAAGTATGSVVFRIVGGATLGTATLASGVARIDNTLDPTADVVVQASYAGDGTRAGQTGTLRRALPTIRATPGGASGWQRTNVTIRYECTRPAGAELAAPCPSPHVFSADAAGQSHTETVRATNGGRATVTVGGIDIDKTGPVPVIQGVTRNADYRDVPPRGRCVASDALSGLVGCVTRTVVTGRDTRELVATATDRAGNRTVVTVPYRQLKEWVVGAPLRGSRFAVKPRSTVRIAATSTRRKPQLMLPRKGGGWTPGPVMVAESVREGLFLFTTTSRLPANVASHRLGVRLQGSKQVQVIRFVAR